MLLNKNSLTYLIHMYEESIAVSYITLVWDQRLPWHIITERVKVHILLLNSEATEWYKEEISIYGSAELILNELVYELKEKTRNQWYLLLTSEIMDLHCVDGSSTASSRGSFRV